MKPIHIAILGLLGLHCLTVRAGMKDTGMVREHLLMDSGWRFHLGNDWPGIMDLAKAGDSGGPAAPDFEDEDWRTLDLPHDWAVELPFDRNADGGHGFKPIGPGFAQNDTGWYRRRFEMPASDQGKRIWLTFDGVYRDATVWVNGWLVRHHESGYYPFREDITDEVRFGDTNVIAVRVDASRFEGWFYEGAGIYRHVWLDETAPVALAPDGVFVRSQFKNNQPSNRADVLVDATILNTLPHAVRIRLRCQTHSPEGGLADTDQQATELDANSRSVVHLRMRVKNPELWSPESPALYTLVTSVEQDGVVVDREETPFGIRTVAFDAKRGFLLNGQPYELKGTCNHQDMAGVGTALPDALQAFRIGRLKAFGCNAYRTSHNPPTPELLDACDRLGMIVMDENRLLGSDSGNLAKWDEQIRRDRNHPSVCIWSVANEEFYVQSTPQGGAVARTMQAYVKQLDPTRPVTYAAPEGDSFAGINGVIEVRGWNYHPGSEMDRYHAEHPDQPNVGTEQASTVCTRGIYADDPERGYVRAYDDRGTQTAHEWWSYFAPRPWLSGGFVWTGFDYRGEPTPYSWPCINSHFGILDTCGFPKDNFWYYKAMWTTNPVLHLLPHWNWRGREGQPIRVEAISNCKAVELSLNGKSLGRQELAPYSRGRWMVPYEPGKLSAEGYDADGREECHAEVETTGQPSTLRLTPDRMKIRADGADVSVLRVSCTDAQDREVPDAQETIHFAIQGEGRILGVGNGDPSCHEPDTYVPIVPVRSLAVGNWKWHTEHFSRRTGLTGPELKADFDDQNWQQVDENNDMPLNEGEQAVYRSHVTLSPADLNEEEIAIHFQTIDDHGWVYVNGQRAGESHDWRAHPGFGIKSLVHAGDNIIVVGVKNDGGAWGLSPDVKVVLKGKPEPVNWSRSLFNGLAEVIVQSTQKPGAIRLEAYADGMSPAACTIQSDGCVLPSSVP